MNSSSEICAEIRERRSAEVDAAIGQLARASQVWFDPTEDPDVSTGAGLNLICAAEALHPSLYEPKRAQR